MRISEWIQASFAIFLAGAVWIFSLPVHRRVRVTWLAAGTVVAVSLARLSVYVLGPYLSSIFRDWLPVVLALVPYWQTGQFFVGPNEKIQAWLVESDRRLLSVVSRTGWKFGRFARLSMEWAYMLCYPLVPAGLATLYAAGLRSEADTYWFVVLVPTYFCYAITPLVPALPPRCLRAGTEVRPMKSRVFNLWILKHGSIHAISFPSGHVAASLAVSLVLLHLLPMAGAVFLAITIWIAVAAVAGGYHYTIDVILGAAVALVFYVCLEGRGAV